ncbi:DUF421 domain-containing protein [candidate division WWE3 bacterium]|uniref:DUF421 domain-containing protein n=1 Tax=candidate division WWE3 bacterium TaxID=2053526 RepID=A0A955RPU7_UNCKA|nr:DUF421 domain-containing protein [candidate division WWE3 bacterium]
MEPGLLVPSSEEILVTVIRTVIIFLYTFLLLRLLGKKQVSQFTWFDILLIVALGSAVGDTMIYPERTVPVFVSMTAIMVVVALVKVFSYLMIHSEKTEDILEGKELLLVNNGNIVADGLSKSDLTERQLRTLLREKGHINLRWVDKVFLETDGEISVIKKSKKK